MQELFKLRLPKFYPYTGFLPYFGLKISQNFKHFKDKPRSNIARLKIELEEKKYELESKRRNSKMQEQDLGIRVTRTVQTNKSNKITFKRFSTTLEVKKPTYNEVKNEAFKHDTLYNKLKTNYAAKVGQKRSSGVTKPGFLE